MMPQIDFGPEDSGFGASGWDRIEAVMCFPEDSDRRSAYLQDCHDRAEAVAECAGDLADIIVEYARRSFAPEVSRASSALPTVWRSLRSARIHDGGFYARELQGSATGEEAARAKGEAKGRIAGFVLLHQLRCSHPDFKRFASIRQARYLVEVMLRRVPKQLRKIGASEAPIRRAWQDSRAVSHLWAARMLAEQEGRFTDFDEPPTLSDFLGWSEQVLKQAVDLRVEGISLENAWRPPSDVEIPAGGLPVPALDPSVITQLENYRHP